MATKRDATVDDLHRVEGKAELVNGELVLLPMTGDAHGNAVMEIAASLHAHGRRTRRGRAFGDGVGFLVHLPNRRSFSPDAAFYYWRALRCRVHRGRAGFCRRSAQRRGLWSGR